MNRQPDSYLIRGSEDLFSLFVQSRLNKQQKKFQVSLWHEYRDRKKGNELSYRSLAEDEIPEDHSGFLSNLPEEYAVERIKLWAQRKFPAVIAKEAKKGYEKLEVHIELLCDYDEGKGGYLYQEDYGSHVFPIFPN